ncbi:MAG: thioredoxin domain-containing protein [Bacteroidota bacterium]
MNTRFQNNLIGESSPYLLQHAHNPVNWYPWGKEALEKAVAENKVILVSIGYSACHWCHVMERESFENETTAALMNKHFVNIKIDREERPDLDHIYMDAVQAISGSGGWPLNVFLTPEAKPFFGGTYFPPSPAFNRPSWSDVLQGISKSWTEKQAEIESQADHLTNHLKQSNNFIQSGPAFAPTQYNQQLVAEEAEEMFSAIMKTADKEWGGFGKAPKFPQTFTIQFLLRYHYFTGSEEALQQALLSIDKMLDGGIYDHVGGGLARYSTDQEWLAPHFEKMLYDNALLVNILCDAYQLTGNKRYESAIRKTIGFISAELSSAEGGFYAALDADSEGEEGRFYVWQKSEVDAVLGKDSALFCSFFDISEHGNWEHKNIPRVLTRIDEFVQLNKLDKTDFQRLVDDALRRLFEVRSARVRPALDDKIILGWNALMADAIAKSSVVLQDLEYSIQAKESFQFLVDNLGNTRTGGLMHTYKNKTAKYPAFLDDYAYVISACLRLYQLDHDLAYLELGKKYIDFVIENFGDDDNLFFFYTNQDQDDVIVRKREVYDGAVPSGNSVMATNLHYFGIYLDIGDWKERAAKMIQSLKVAVIKHPGSFGIWASLLLETSIGMNEVAIIGKGGFALAKEVQQNFIPNLVMMVSNKQNGNYALLANKPELASDNLYLCRNYSCLAPFQKSADLLTEINLSNKIRR